MTGAQAMTLLETLYKISQVSRGQYDEAAHFARFKYTVGWNINQLRAVQNAIAKKQNAIMAKHEDERAEYDDQRKAIMETYAKRDDKGNIVRDDHGYVFADSAIQSVKGAIDNLRSKSRAALERADKDAKAANAVLSEPVDVLLRCVSIADVPSLVAGGWLPALDPILVDAPGDADHEAVNFVPVSPRFPRVARLISTAKTMLTGCTSKRKCSLALLNAAEGGAECCEAAMEHEAKAM